MKAIITGLNGTIAPYLKTKLESNLIDVINWNRTKVNPDDFYSVEKYITDNAPDYLYHFAMGSPEWAKKMAEVCKAQNIKFVYISTVSVYGENNSGPYTIDSTPMAEDDYGKYKLSCEKAVFSVNDESFIIRIGWQIAPSFTTDNNNMLNYLETQNNTKSLIEVSSKWFPSASFIDDTIEAIYRIVFSNPPGLYLVNGNPGLSMYEVTLFLKKHFNKDWNVCKNDSFSRNDIMIDDRVQVKSIIDKI